MSALGRHILVELYNCKPEILNDVALIEKGMEDASKRSGATIINTSFHHFSPYGVSGVVVIQESHLAIHTWPEYGFAAVDLFTCGDTVDPWISYEYLKSAFEASHGSAVEMRRGEMRLLSKTSFETLPHRDDQTYIDAIKRTRDIWFTERNNEIAFSLKHKGQKLFDQKSPFQRVEVYDTLAFGKMLTLDGMVMTTEKDEYVYHEMITHVPMLCHPSPKNILIIGGGDGGTAREVLKHSLVEKVTLVEIDQQVVEASRKFLPSLGSAFENPKLDLVVADGIKYVHESADEAYDIVIVDSTDPVGPSRGLFTSKFYTEVHRVLSKDGIMVTQSESPRFNQKVFQEIYGCYREIFGERKVYCYLAYIPTYPTGMWSFSFCSKGSIHPIESIHYERQGEFVNNNRLSYYNEGIHYSAFVLPNFVKELLEVEVNV